MVFGGAMHPDSDAEHAWLAGETAFIERTLASGVPLLGVCLGAQLVARAAGAHVGPAEEERSGGTTSSSTTTAPPIRSSAPSAALRRVPVALLHLRAAGESGRARDEPGGPAGLPARRAHLAVQFHPEVERHMLDHWFDVGRDELPKPVEEMAAETDRQLARWNEHGRALCGAFLDEAAAL